MSTFVHMELNTGDVKQAKKFYQGIFGWKYQDMKMPDGIYSIIQGPNGGIGGIQKNPMDGTPNQWVGYVAVASIKRTIAKVTRRGGTVVVPETDVPGMGKLAVFLDPQGATFAAWEATAQKADDEKKATKKKATKKKATKKKAAKKKATKKKAAKKKAATETATKKKATKKKATKKKATKKTAAKKKAAKKK